MVFEKIREALSPSDEKYEVLYYRYSKLKLENQHLKEKMITDSRVFREDLSKGVALDLIKLYEHVEVAKQDSFK
ncbi:MAG: hypothetical protein KC548_04005, partial [Nanoarchaeota archaeon]|nr:hypothetical protein [Nanoarchaeota archaeon]